MRKKKEHRRHDIYSKPPIEVNAGDYQEIVVKALNEHAQSDKKDIKPDLALTSASKLEDESMIISFRSADDRFIASYKFILSKNGKYRKCKTTEQRVRERDIPDPADKIEWTPEQEAIAKVLEEEYGFGKVRGVWRPFLGNGSENAPDIHKVSHVLRIHVLHYLFYSPVYKHFIIAVKHDEPKGEAGGGMRLYTHVMIPKLINKEDDAREFLTGLLGKDVKRRLMPYPI